MQSAPDALLESLSQDYRRVLSRWRALIYLRRASRNLQPHQRRWQREPASTEDMAPILRRMQKTGTIEPVPTAPGCYAVMDHYARNLPIRELELLFELNPYSVVTHYSALEHHGLTLDQPKLITVWSGSATDTIPPGTDELEWSGLALPVAYRPSHVQHQKVRWFTKAYDNSFGVVETQNGPTPIRVTDRERSLIDSLQWPEYSGGILNVLRAWTLGSESIDLDTIITYTELYPIRLLRQRVGYVSESLGFTHARFDMWAAESVRGGSSKLVGAEPFSSDYNDRWNISLNAPVGELVKL